jgi:hypothetical protein
VELVDLFSEEARSKGIDMTLWVDSELPGDLRIHLENKRKGVINEHLSVLGMRIEQVLANQGLVSRRRLMAAEEEA